MWSSYVKPVVWSSFVPCSTYYSTSEVVDSISTSYLTVPVTSYSWTTGTSYTTISTTVTATDYTTQTQTTDDTTWTTATSLTTEPVLVTQHYSTTQTLLTTEPVLSTQYFETTTTLLTTQPISTYETVRTTLTGHKTQTDLETIYTTASLTQTYVTSQTAVTTLTSRTTYETLETLETLVTSQVPVASSLVPLPHPPSSPPPPPPSASSSPPPVISTTPSVVVSSPESTAAPPPVTTSPPPPPPPNPCDKPPVNEFFSVSWFGWRPVPGAEPLVTFYPTIYAGSNITLTSTFCNTQAFEKYYRTNLFDCARGCGPYQTLNDECSIVIGPVFTGTTCGGTGYKITQYGSSGNVVDLDTSIVGRGLTVDGTCIPTTTTVLQTPFIYTGDVRRRNSLETAVARRQASSGDQVAINPSGLADPFSQANNADFNYGDEGRQDSLPGASELFADPKIVDTPPPSSGEGTALPANEPTQASQAPQSPPAESQQQTTTPATQVLTTEPTGSPPILPTSETTAMSGGTQGSMSIVPSGEASLPALTCVPPSMVLPSSATGDSTGLQTSSASGTSLPQQTGNAASHSVALSRSLDWLCAWLGLYLLV